MEQMICDRIHFGISEENKALKDSLVAAVKEIKDSRGVQPALEVTLDATHGGYVNKNYAMYKPDGQKNSFRTFFTPFPKPILTEHDDEKDPIGRVIDAEFVPIAPQSEADPKSKIRIKGLITDGAAIQKVLDGRYMTVSISGRPKTPPTCSVCNEKIVGWGGCKEEHMRGQAYDGKMCHYIFDELEYSEVSFVNKPADQSGTHAAAVVSMRIVEAPAMDADAQKMYSEAIQKIKGATVVADAADAKPEVKPEVTPDPTPEPEDNKSVGCPECDSFTWSDAEIAEVTKLVDAGEDADAVLSAAQRKKMSSGTFCGPARSYPVPDCSHGANAKARATQQVKAGKLSAGSAAKIKACANRKMKSMACGGSDGLTTGNIIVDALIEMVNELRDSYEADLAAAKKQGKDSVDAVTKEMAGVQGKVTALETELAATKELVTKAEDKHKQDLTQASELTKSIRAEKSKNVLLLSLILGKDSILNTFGGKNAEERAASYEKKLQEFKDNSIEELTNREEGLLAELTKQAIVRLDIMGPVDPKLDKTITEQRNRKQRLESWFKEGH